MPDRSPFAALWTLRPDVAYLNHGSFGACPSAILGHQSRLREALEREPMDFLVRELPHRLREARETLARFLGADPEGLVFVPNATTGVNAVLRSLDLRAGDEILTTDHVYAACRKAIAYAAMRSGGRVVMASVPFPVDSDDAIVEAVLARVTSRTRLALIDHVTSPTALIVPVARLARELEARGVDVLVDGAHAPGMVLLDIEAIGVAYYTGNAHKWLCAPKGAAVLHVREDRRHLIHPTAISHGYDPDADGARLIDEFDWPGTFDPTAWLAAAACVGYMGTLVEGGWPALMERNHRLALRARDVVTDALDVPAPCPDAMIGAMASIPLPAPAPGSPAERLDHDGWASWMRDRGIESWFYPWGAPGRQVVRVSAQLYNDESEYERLAAHLVEALRGRA